MFSTWFGVVLLFVVFGLFVWVVIGASPRSDTYEEKRATTIKPNNATMGNLMIDLRCDGLLTY